MEKNNESNRFERIVILLLLLIIIVPAIILNNVFESKNNLSIEDNKIHVCTESFKINEIEEIELLDDVNVSRVKGTGTRRYIKGIGKIEGESEDAILYIYKNSSPYIKIRFSDKLLVYNDDNSEDTKEIYSKLIEVTQK